MEIRRATPEDAAELARVFHTAVREGPSFYNQTQRAAWAPHVPQTTAFAARLASMHVVVAEAQREIVGFMAMDPTGYIDLVFIVALARGRGAFRQMYGRVEREARATGLHCLWTHASLMAEPAFRAMGFSVIQRQIVERGGETLPRAQMEKRLT